jgi:hypothetical protein
LFKIFRLYRGIVFFEISHIYLMSVALPFRILYTTVEFLRRTEFYEAIEGQAADEKFSRFQFMIPLTFNRK